MTGRLLARGLAVLGVMVALAGAAAMGVGHVQADRRGVDEITYIDLRPADIPPGGAVTQAFQVQDVGLSRIGLLYSYWGVGTAPVRVTLRSSGRTLAQADLALPSTATSAARITWWAQGAANSYARIWEVPVQGRAQGTVTVTVSVPAGGHPIVLYWSPPPPNTIPSVGDPQRRYAMRTEYGAVRPALLQAPTMVARMAAVGAPWLPAPALWALAAVLLLLSGVVTWRVSAHAPGAGAGGPPATR